MHNLESTHELAVAEANVRTLMERFNLSYLEAKGRYMDDFQVAW